MKVSSEINTLKKVLLHRPHNELKVLNKDNIHYYLFDELPELKTAQIEHDTFANILKENGVEVVYLVDLMVEVLNNNDIKEKFIKDYLNEANCQNEDIYKDLFSISNSKDLVLKTMEGYNDIIDAMPNLYFTRDPFTIIDNSIALYHMRTNIRHREGIYGQYINKYHKDFHLTTVYERTYEEQIEGGDVLVLSKDVIVIGISERSGYKAANRLALNLFEKTNIQTVLTIEIPSKRACMHLDTVLTRINENTFVFYDKITNLIKLKIINKEGTKDINKSLKETFSDLLKIKNIKFICVNKPLDQWNDACNSLCIAPNNIVVYDINKNINKKFISDNIKVNTIPSKELLKGRGGPHCMSMPLIRGQE